MALADVPARPGLDRTDALAALAIFLIVVAATFPVVLPFIAVCGCRGGRSAFPGPWPWPCCSSAVLHSRATRGFGSWKVGPGHGRPGQLGLVRAQSTRWADDGHGPAFWPASRPLLAAAACAAEDKPVGQPATAWGSAAAAGLRGHGLPHRGSRRAERLLPRALPPRIAARLHLEARVNYESIGARSGLRRLELLRAVTS
ncbi:MAG: hypothetical protein MZW92_74315 [Comamonadaceae bacterium]|nr:hypothetical protein [Comamonadaceae bacterium]